MPAWISFVVLSLLTSVHAAFTTELCSINNNYCIRRSQSGAVCLYSNFSTSAWACRNTTYQLPLEAHLNQRYSIGYYTAGGQHLGGSNFSLTSATLIYACMSARVNVTSAEYVTYCGGTTADNDWNGGGCAVNVVPANVLDGCYTGPNTTGTTTNRGTATISMTHSDDQLRVPSATLITTATILPDTLPSSSSSIIHNVLKGNGYLVIWASITILLIVTRL